MQIKQEPYTIVALNAERHRINLNPAWQRGPSWRPPRQALLIDSILRGMDLPKIYLRALPQGSAHAYDAVDGQQRLRAIWEFQDDNLPLDYIDPLLPINNVEINGLLYSELPKDLKSQFDEFELSIAIIEQANQDEITTLFARLQMGVSLNPAELRNALNMPMRHVIDTIATSHEFFQNSKIAGAHYKRQDYVTHIFAMAAYNCTKDIKAPDLKAMLLEYDASRLNEILEISAAVGDALNVLANVNRAVGYRITQKWIFSDLCWLIMERQAQGAIVDPAKIAASYQNFESQRRQHTSSPEYLLRGRPVALKRHLYNYITAFRIEGARASNLEARATALRAFFPDIDM